MTRTRWAGHTWLLFTAAMIGCAVYTATINPWLLLPAWTATSISAGLAYGYYRKAGREEQVARRLAVLRGTATAAYRIPSEQFEERLRKDQTA